VVAGLLAGLHHAAYLLSCGFTASRKRQTRRRPFWPSAPVRARRGEGDRWRGVVRVCWLGSPVADSLTMARGGGASALVAAWCRSAWQARACGGAGRAGAVSRGPVSRGPVRAGTGPHETHAPRGALGLLAHQSRRLRGVGVFIPGGLRAQLCVRRWLAQSFAGPTSPVER